MEDQKMENLLNLAVDATPEEREKSLDLETGYDPQEKTWEVIVRYSGSLEEVFALGIRGEELLGGYGILWVPQSLLPAVSNFPQIEYMEKPKRLFFAVNQAKAASCFAGVQEGGLGLSGAGVLVGILDSGIDYFHRDFRNEDGSTRILFLWDQVLEQIYDEAQINEALNAPARGEGQAIVPSVDVSGHGTAVAGIAAGNGRDSGGLYRGAAYGSSLIVVKLGTAQAEGFPRTTQLMRALDFVLKKAVELGRLIAVNISIGNTYGSHDGTSLLETFMDEAAGFGRNVIVVGSGNEGGSAGHASGVLSEGRQAEILVSVAPYETSLSVQLWKAYADQFRVTLVAPSGEQLGPFSETLGPQRYGYRSAQGETRILVYYGKPSPYSRFQEIYLDFIPEQTYIGSGIWRILLEPVKILSGQYDLWLPSHNLLNPSTRFLGASPDTTLTIPSTAGKAITVGAYDPSYQSYAQFSGRGYTRLNQVKPDLAAPGTNITAPAAGGGYERVTGTSFAAPFVTGAAALIMEWGIVKGNDPFLYGEKVKAYLQRGARQLPGFETWPNPQLGDNVIIVSS